MKILYCNPCFWEYRLPFYKKLNDLFHGDFYIMYSPNRFRGHEKLLDTIKHEMGNNACPFNDELIYDAYTRSFKEFTEGHKHFPFPFGLLRRIRKVRPDVLITEGFFQWTPLVVLYGFLFRVPIFIGYERTLHTERNSGKIRKWHRQFTDWFVRGYLVNGSETKKYLMSIGVKESKIHIGGMSADSEGLRKGIASLSDDEKLAFKAKYQKEDGLVYLFSGRVEELKGAPHLLAAWEKHVKKYANDVIVLIGMGDKYEELKKKYESEKSIYLEGRVEYKNVHKYYAIADVFILPTLQDNWSLVIPEAMSCGLPVATSIYNGCHTELIHEGENGTTFDTFDEASMIRALDFFHGRDLKQMGRKSIEFEKPFDTEHCAQRAYNAIVKNVK